MALIAGIGVAVALAPLGVQAVVPAPGADEAVITVRVGGDRLSGAITDTGPADAAISGLAGARLGLFAAPTDGSPISAPWASCISDADGDCSFVVPDTQVGGAHRDARFTVKQLSAPAGWSTATSLRTHTAAGGTQTTAYQFLTGPELRAGSTYVSTSDFMYAPATTDNLDVATASSGVSLLERDNPAVVDRCGLDVAIILDTSSSVGSAMPQLVDAADSLVDALTGTRSRAAAFSFAALSPGANAGPNHAELTSISTADGASVFKQQYAGWGISTGTSWDRGLFAAASAPEHYDVAVIITDGNPDLYGDPRPVTRSVKATRFKELEYGIASANALKAKGTRVIAIGVGSGIGVAPISGPTLYDGSNPLQADRFALADYAAAGAALHDLATSLCQGSLSVVTELVPAGNSGEDVSGASPVGAGWGVTTSTTTSGVSGLPSTVTTTEDGTGAVTFPIGFGSGVSSAALAVSPSVASGYHVVTQGGQNAACHDLGTGVPIAVTNAAGGFQVEARPETATSCIVYIAANPVTPPGLFTPISVDPIAVAGRIEAIQDVDGDGRLSAGDTVIYAYDVTNLSGFTLHNVMLVSAVLGAVVCPQTQLAQAVSTTCVAHAPYVVSDADVTAGQLELGAHAEGLNIVGSTLQSSTSTVTTMIGDRIPVALTARGRP
ncbi:DUF7507 domain-containing protein [Nocardioides marmorisolisilvae]|uniref:DUF7507 domain-containing protein n=1 Tax=Nocardioides marmorisolisilvae TaxID=1542737 RepID=UPI00161099C3|nr:VWA domain-containing protein [Nocardioides marmorisolisilvae]